MGISARDGSYLLDWVNMPWPRVDHCGEMESAPRLGLGTINIVSFVEGLIFY